MIWGFRVGVRGSRYLEFQAFRVKGFSVNEGVEALFRDVTEHLCLVEYLFSSFKGLL